MARVKDITDKLSFEGNPILVIKGKELEVNGDAPTMLKIMGLTSGGGMGNEDIKEAYDLLFSEEARKEIDGMKLNTKDWMIVVQEAMTLVDGEEESKGE